MSALTKPPQDLLPAMPEIDWTEKARLWRSRTTGLFQALRVLAAQGDRAVIQRSLDNLASWHSFVDLDTPRRRELVHQWMTARRLCWCALQTPHSPELRKEIDLARSLLALQNAPDFIRGHEAWAQHCIRELVPPGGSPLDVRSVVVTVALGNPAGAATGLARVVLEVIRPGTGKILQHPEFTFETPVDPSFSHSLERAWSAARGIFDADDPLGLCDGRWRLLSDSGGPMGDVEGPSAGGAAAWGWRLLLLDRLPDPGLIVLAESSAAGELSGVGQIDGKVEAITKAGRFDTIVTAVLEDALAARAKIKTLGQAGATRVVLIPASEPSRNSLRDALRNIGLEDNITLAQPIGTGLETLAAQRSRLAEELCDYLEAAALKAAELPGYFPPHLGASRNGRTPFDEIRQVVRVVGDRSFLEKMRKELERLRAAGQDLGRRAYLPPHSSPGGEEGEEGCELMAGKGETDQLVPWDAQAGEKFPRAVILGDPGYGKTWLLRYEARRLACDAAERLRRHTLRLEDLVLPIYSRCSDLNDQDDPFDAALVRRVRGERSQVFVDFVITKLKSDKCVVLMDAFDEVPEEKPKAGEKIAFLEKHRQRLGQRIAKFAEAFPNPRLLLTCRIVEYQASPFAESNELVLVDFEQRQIESFVRIWFPDRAKQQRVLSMLEQTPRVLGLARIPLMLTLMCRLWQKAIQTAEPLPPDEGAAQNLFPTRRWEIYERCLSGLFIERESERQGRAIRADEVEPLLQLLQSAAFDLFRERYEQFSASLLRLKIIGFQRSNPSHELANTPPDNIISALVHSGILVKTLDQEDPSYLLLHRIFHEFLAARHLSQDQFCQHLVELARNHYQAWWEVALLAGSIRAARQTDSAWQLIDALCPHPCDPASHPSPSDADFRMAWLAGHILLESEVHLAPLPTTAQPGLLDRVRTWLAVLLEDSRLPVRERARAGVVLGKLRDPRKGVGLIAQGLPEMHWIPIRAGDFTMGGEASWDGGRKFVCKLLREKPYQIGRYPVTVTQFDAFQRDGGYREPKWWTSAGWAWKEQGRITRPEPYRDILQTANHPVVGVSWYEAIAFCNWLTNRLRAANLLEMNQVVTLPSEPQWERAARGPNGNVYPWGDSDEDLGEKCNCFQSGIGSTCAVGMFRVNEKICQARDMAGNVWEWCRTKYREYDKDYEASTDDSLEGDALRVVRGGSWADGLPAGLRASCRGRGLPGGRVRGDGFRCVVVLGSLF